jgi:basic amino acid/polyamine antiporter, APA family
MVSDPQQGARLERQVGLGGAVLIGLGSMIGTGVFVSIGIAAGVAGPSLLAATALAAALAAANGLSSAQLAAAHPVSGGTYEYGYRWLTPTLGFSAGWLFLLAKSASAATAALGLAGYLLGFWGPVDRGLQTALAAGATLTITALVASGIRRSNWANAVIVAATLGALLLLVVAAVPVVVPGQLGRFTPILPGMGDGWVGLLHGAALMFVAYTGYGRIATLGEEVKEPERTIPRAIITTMIVVALLYMAVAFAGIGTLGAHAFGLAAEETAAPLQAVADATAVPYLAQIMALAAVTAMIGVLLNLLLGLSRVLLAMARRGDAPAPFERVSTKRSSPVAAVWACGLIILALTLVGDVRLTWSFSAFTVLLYYALTNAAALRLPPEHRLYPRWIAASGLGACLALAFFVDPAVWITGLALIAAGLAARSVARSVPKP